MIAIILVATIVLALALRFLWPPFFAILLIGAHPVIWVIFAVVLGLIIVLVENAERWPTQSA